MYSESRCNSAIAHTSWLSLLRRFVHYFRVQEPTIISLQLDFSPTKVTLSVEAETLAPVLALISGDYMGLGLSRI